MANGERVFAPLVYFQNAQDHTGNPKKPPNPLQILNPAPPPPPPSNAPAYAPGVGVPPTPVHVPAHHNFYCLPVQVGRAARDHYNRRAGQVPRTVQVPEVKAFLRVLDGGEWAPRTAVHCALCFKSTDVAGAPARCPDCGRVACPTGRKCCCRAQWECVMEAVTDVDEQPQPADPVERVLWTYRYVLT